MLKKKKSRHLQRKLDARKPNAKVDPHVEEQFLTGRLYGELTSGYTKSSNAVQFLV